MIHASACPGREQLELYHLGKLTEEESGALDSHMSGCQSCLCALEGLRPDDPLLATIRSGRTIADSLAEEPDSELVARLCQLQPAAGAEDHTLAATPMPEGKSLSTPAKRHGDKPQSDERTQESLEFLAPPEQEDEIGWLGGYRVLEILGSGGMGIVFKAEDTKLQRLVALKVMKPSVAEKPQAKERFLREARATATVKNDHVITIYQVDEQEGVPFLAMELLEGKSLDAALKSNSRFTLPQILRIGREIALGLAAAHKRGLIHRDIKPGNIWLEPENGGRVKVLDFGLVRLSAGHGTASPGCETGEEEQNLTQSGVLVGTPAYMAPEQAEGKPLDARCDLFSLGCVLFRMCSGQLPFQGETTMAVLRALAVEEATPLHELNAGIPKELADLVMQLLAKVPDQRPQFAREVVQIIKSIERSGQATPLNVQEAIAAVHKAPASPARAETAEFAAPAINENKPTQTESKPESEPPAQARPAAPLPHGRGSVKNRRLFYIAAGLLILLFGSFGAFQIFQGTYRTPHGTFVVELKGDDIEARFKNGKILLYDKNGLLKYTLSAANRHQKVDPGKYTIRIIGADGLAVDTDEFTMLKGKWFSVRVRLLEPVTALPNSNQPSGEPISDCAFVSNPGKRQGIFSWTIDTRTPRALFHLTAFSPNNKWLATAGDKFRIWDVQTGKLVHILFPKISYPVESITWSPDSKLIAAAGYSGSFGAGLTIWKPKNGQLLNDFNGKIWPASAAFSPKGDIIACCVNAPPRLLLLNVFSGKIVKTLYEKSHSASVVVSWSPDGKLLSTCNDDGAVRIWNVDTGQLQRKIESQKAKVVRLTWTLDGKHVAFSTRAGKIRLLEVGTGQLKQIAETGPMVFVAKKPEFATGKDFPHYLQVDDKSVLVVGVNNPWESPSFSKDGRYFAGYMNGEHRLTIYDLKTGKPLHRFQERNYQGAHYPDWSPDGSRLAISEDQITQAVSIWDTAKGARLRLLENAFPYKLRWSPDNQTLAVTFYRQNDIALWNTTTGKRIDELNGHSSPANDVVWSPDGKQLASVSYDGTVRIWDVISHKTVQVLKDHAKAVKPGVAWSPNGKFLAYGTGKLLQLLDGTTGKLIQEIKNPVEYPLAWSPDGKILAGRFVDGDKEGRVRFWDTGTWKVINESIESLGGTDMVMSWLKGQKTLQITHRYGHYFLFKAAPGAAAREVVDHQVPYSNTRGFHPKGSFYARDFFGAVRITQINPAKPVMTFTSLDKRHWIAISPEGHYRGSPGIEMEIVYVVQTKNGQETLTPDEFAQNYGWKNDPDQVRLPVTDPDRRAAE